MVLMGDDEAHGLDESKMVFILICGQVWKPFLLTTSIDFAHLVETWQTCFQLVLIREHSSPQSYFDVEKTCLNLLKIGIYAYWGRL